MHSKLHNATIFKSRFHFYAAKTRSNVLLPLCCVKTLAHLVVYLLISAVCTIRRQLRTSLLFSYRFFFTKLTPRIKTSKRFLSAALLQPPQTLAWRLCRAASPSSSHVLRSFALFRSDRKFLWDPSRAVSDIIPTNVRSADFSFLSRGSFISLFCGVAD